MTREEAIKVLNTYDVNFYEYTAEEIVDAIEMAIEALKRERTDEWCPGCKEYDMEKKCCPRFNRVIRGAMNREPSEDLISRAEAIEHFMRLSEDESLTPYTQMLMIGVSNEIKKLPSADRPRGEWIETAQDYYEMVNKKGGGVNENTEYFADDIACPNCLAKFSNIDNETERFNFCPNCGSDMGGDAK